MIKIGENEETSLAGDTEGYGGGRIQDEDPDLNENLDLEEILVDLKNADNNDPDWRSVKYWKG